MKPKIKELTTRSNGWGYEKRKQKLREDMRGWIGYFHFAEMKTFVKRPANGFVAEYACAYGKFGRRPRLRLQT